MVEGFEIQVETRNKRERGAHYPTHHINISTLCSLICHWD